jgi:hypothetical protein
MKTVGVKQNMMHICIGGKQVSGTTEVFYSTSYNSKHIHSNKHYCNTCMLKNEWSFYE